MVVVWLGAGVFGREGENAINVILGLLERLIWVMLRGNYLLMIIESRAGDSV
jgi:hypothetical protein